MNNHQTCFVASFPGKARWNPYITLFFKALKPYGVEILQDAEFNRGYFSSHKKQIGIVHLHWLEHIWRNPSLVLSAVQLCNFCVTIIYIKLIKKKLVWTCHNLFAHESPNPIDFFMAVFVSNMADLVICHNTTLRQKLKLFVIKPAKITLLPYPPYGGIYPNTIKREEAKRILGVNQEKPVYLFFGLIRKYKGIDDLIRAFKELNDRNAILYIVGKGIKNNYIKDYIIPLADKATNIKLIDSFVKDEELQVYFNSADALVFPFKRVWTSSSFMLSYLFRKPVVVRDSALAREFFDEDSALYFKDKATFISALKQVMQIDIKKASEALRLKNNGIESAWGQILPEFAHSYRTI